MLNRNLFYTAITRAKETIVIVGQVKAVKRMIRNVVTDKRNTRLSELLRSSDIS